MKQAPDIQDTDALQPVDIDDLRQFWITAHVPLDAAPESYTSTITIQPSNAAPTSQLSSSWANSSMM